MIASTTYYRLRIDIIESCASGDLDNSYNQVDMSLEALDKLYTDDRFQSLETFEADKLKLLTEIQEVVDQRIFREMYGMKS